MSYSDHYHGLSGHTHLISQPVYGWTDTSTTWTGLAQTMKQYETLTTPKEPPMTILEQMRKERKEAIERQRIERVYAAYDEFNLDRLYDGTVLVFTWTPEGTDKTYTYAALRTGEKWYVTGRESPNGLDVEDFVAWLIGKDIEPDDLEVRAP